MYHERETKRERDCVHVCVHACTHTYAYAHVYGGGGITGWPRLSFNKMSPHTVSEMVIRDTG
jgi:hypothetical protein